MTKIALVQFTASTNKDENLKKILNYIGMASKKGAKLCAFPEFMMFYTNSKQKPKQLAKLAETINGNFVKEISKSAKENHIEVVGTFYEKSKIPNKVYDTAFVLNSCGKIISTYRKIHLYDALGFKESTKLAAGSKISTPVKSTAGKLGLQICYDLRFPEVSRTLAVMGSQVLVAPSAWVRGPQKEEHWLAINKTRAIENGCYIVAPDQTGNIYCGRSLIVDPFGRIILDMKKRQGLGIAEINPDVIIKTRKILPLLKSRRRNLYPKI